MPKKLPRSWRGVFLRALKRTGNVRASAFAAGVDPGTAYDHRIKDAAFEAKWEAALATFKDKAAKEPLHRPGSGPGRSPSPANAGEELVARRSKNHGVQLVRSAPGRWDSGKEAAFLAGLRETGCVRAAADAAGLSTTAFYNRRENYADFAQRWDAMLAESKARLPELLNAAGLASLDPDMPRRGRRLPKVNVDQAIRISRINDSGKGGAAGRRPPPPVATKAELIAALTKSLDVLRRRDIANGWREGPDGVLMPPGWAHVGEQAGWPGDDAESGQE